MTVPVRTTAAVAWAAWLATVGCCAAGLVFTLAMVRPLTIAGLAAGAALALATDRVCWRWSAGPIP